MTTAWLPADYANAALAGAYGTVGLVVVAAAATRSFPRTATIGVFVSFLLLQFLCRGVYFGIPNSVWSLNEDPTHVMAKYSSEWWLNLAQFAVHELGNFFMDATLVQILKLWHKALCVVGGVTAEWPEHALNGGIVTFLLWQVWAVCSNFVLPSQIVVAMCSVAQTVVSAVVALLFAVFWWRLWKAMRSLAHHRSTWETLVHACACCGPRPDGGELGLALAADTSQANLLSARSKLKRITLLSLFYTLSALGKSGVYVYQLYLVMKNAFPDVRFHSLHLTDIPAPDLITIPPLCRAFSTSAPSCDCMLLAELVDGHPR